MSTANPIVTSLRERLRHATRELHAALDSDPLSAALLSADVTIDTYRRFLERTYGFLAPLERQLAAAPLAEEQAACGLALSDRTPLLRADLAALGADTVAIDTLPTMAALADVSRRGHALGMRYVVEGSAMGGLVIAQHVGKRLGVSPASGGRFLVPSGDPRTVAQTFQRFVGVLDAFARDAQDEQDALDAGRATFAAIGAWFRAA
jgi:heme oxygenase